MKRAIYIGMPFNIDIFLGKYKTKAPFLSYGMTGYAYRPEKVDPLHSTSFVFVSDSSMPNYWVPSRDIYFTQ